MRRFKQLHSTDIKSALILILLTLLAVMGNNFGLNYFLGIDFIFGSVFLFIIVYLYGIKWGFPAAIIANFCSMQIYRHPLAALIFTLEILVVGLHFRRKGHSMILLDGIFWLVIGGPLLWVCNTYFMHLAKPDVLLILLEDTINGVFNALFASLIFDNLPIRKWVFNRETDNLISIDRILFNLVISSVLIPTLLLSMAHSQDFFYETQNEIKRGLIAQRQEMSLFFSEWCNIRVNGLQHLAQNVSKTNFTSIADMQRRTAEVMKVFPDFWGVYIADAQGITLTFEPLMNDQKQSNIGLNFSDRKYYKELVRTHQPVMSDVIQSRGAVVKPIVTMSVPVLINEEFRGFITGGLNLEEISVLLRDHSFKHNQKMTLVDRNNRIVATTGDTSQIMKPFRLPWSGNMEQIDDTFFLWSPTKKGQSQMKIWQDSSYFLRAPLNGNLPWSVVIETPFLPYAQILRNYYIRCFAIILVVGILAFLLAAVFSRMMTRPILRLTEITTDFPTKVASWSTIRWPGSTVQEIEALVTNFKEAATTISNNFVEIKRAKKKLEYLAYYDTLTNLPNRVLFNRMLNSAILKAQAEMHMTAVMFIDLDRFKMVNDTLGHNAGDDLLCKVGLRLTKKVGDSCTLCRFGGDEFTLLLPAVTEVAEVEAVAQKVLDVFQSPILVNEHEFYINASIGIAIYPNDGQDVEALVKNADRAMYRAKEFGDNTYQFYDGSMNYKILERLKIESKLRKALEQNEFFLCYQPQMNVQGQIVGAEALIRWKNPELGLISPKDFINIAEETGLILPIGEWVLRTACKQNKAWQDAGYPPIRIAVNISARQFQQQNLVEKLRTIISETGLAPQWLEIEITESITIQNISFTIKTLEELKKMGVYIAIDDFGTGFSSLNYLKNFKIDTLKIDSSFVSDVPMDEDDAAIVTAIINLAKILKLKVIAEGVETYEQLAFLKMRSCDEIQGYLISKPVTAPEFEGFLRS